MTGELQLHDEDGDARCVHCGATAIGPCASCNRPVCGDCCVLTEGGARVYAICLGCNRHSGRSLRRAWLMVVAWVMGPLLILALAVVLLSWLTNR